MKGINVSMIPCLLAFAGRLLAWLIKAAAIGWLYAPSEPQDAQESAWLDYAVKSSTADRTAFRATLSTADQTKFDAMRERMVGKRGAANDEVWRMAA